MKKLIIFFILFIFVFQVMDAQKNLLYIYDQRKFSHIGIGINGEATYLFSIKSKNKNFQNDAFLFSIPNQEGFETYKPLNEIVQKVDLDTLDFINLDDLTKKDPWNLHNFLSSQKKIFLVRNKSGNQEKFVMYPLIYEGTRKNRDMLKLH